MHLQRVSPYPRMMRNWYYTKAEVRSGWKFDWNTKIYRQCYETRTKSVLNRSMLSEVRTAYEGTIIIPSQKQGREQCMAIIRIVYKFVKIKKQRRISARSFSLPLGLNSFLILCPSFFHKFSMSESQRFLTLVRYPFFSIDKSCINLSK